MGEFRTSYTGRYKLSRERYLHLYYWVMDEYPQWVAEYRTLSDTRKATRANDEIKADALPSDPTSETGIRLARLSGKINLVEQAAKDAAGDLWPYLIKHATTPGCAYNTLRMQDGIPCGRRQYYDMRRKFYWLLSERKRGGKGWRKKDKI